MSNANGSVGAPLRATPSKDPAVRMLIVAVMALGFGLWCVYEAYISNDPDVIAKYQVLPADLPEKDLFSAKLTLWFNRTCAYLLPVVGLVFLGLGVRQMCRRLSMDDAGIHAGSETVAWADIREIDATELKKKDILHVLHGNGKLKLDGYLWQKGDFQKMVALVEQRVPSEKIKR